jgi:AcrR family transcriptional regulator
MPATRLIRQLRAERTRLQLLDAARAVFAEQGYAGTTIDEIAGAAGVSKGAYYFHFSSKEGVFVALIDEWVKDVSKRLEALAGEKRDLRPMLDALLSSGSPVWSPRLLIEFWSQAERSKPVEEAVARARRAWRAAAAKSIARAYRARLLADGLTADAAVNMLQTIRDGLVVQASLPGAGNSSQRSALRAALGLLQRPRPPLRRAG